MEDHQERDMAVFHQVCEVNDLNPETIQATAKELFPENFRNGQDAEKLIWTALDQRARTLLNEAVQTTQKHEVAYTIDGDPAAPAFVVNEDKIRSQFGPETAEKVIDALGKVQLPVQP